MKLKHNLFLAFLTAVFALASVQAQSATWTIDPAHSSA
jgi:polyisoprenoid-binding protein YceI